MPTKQKGGTGGYKKVNGGEKLEKKLKKQKKEKEKQEKKEKQREEKEKLFHLEIKMDQ